MKQTLKDFWVSNNEQIRDYKLADITSEANNLPKNVKLFWLKSSKGHICNILQKPNKSEQPIHDKICLLESTNQEYQVILSDVFTYGIHPKISNPLDAMAIEEAIFFLNNAK